MDTLVLSDAPCLYHVVDPRMGVRNTPAVLALALLSTLLLVPVSVLYPVAGSRMGVKGTTAARGWSIAFW